ncbi:MAG TPA: hypothetical protein VLD83_02165 [Candidatus Binatia bacterium]|nr:hypothetical protein [Candidatus Binatia bacterium]
MEDKDYIADANKSKLPADDIFGEQVEQYVQQIYSISAEVRNRLDFLVRKRKPS